MLHLAVEYFGKFFILFILLIFILEAWLRSLPAYKAAVNIPGGRLYPIVGNLFEAVFLNHETTIKYVQAQAKKYKQGYRFYTFNSLHYWPIKATEIEFVMNSSKHIEKSFFYDFLKPMLGDGLLISSNKKWHQRRKILTPAFHFNILQQFLTIFKEESKRFVDNLDDIQHKNGTEIQDMVSRFTLSNICETAMGVKLNSSENSDIYRKMINKSGEILVLRYVNPLLYSDRIFNLTLLKKNLTKCVRKIHDFSWSVIDQRREQFKLRNKVQVESSAEENIYFKSRYAMLDTLLEAEEDGQKIDEDGIREEVDTFMFEGYDTTSTGLTFLLFMIAIHQDAQQRIFEEVSEIYENNQEKEFSIHDYGSMKYMDLVMKETFRLYPPVPYISRSLEEDIDLGHIQFPKKTQFHIYIFNLHRDPDQFPNPTVFDPDRFLPENCEKRHTYAYIPFSAGPRNCIGQKFAILEIKALLASILLKYRLESITKEEEIVLMSDLILRTKEPIKVKFIKRK